jgi:hypothetical protein
MGRGARVGTRWLAVASVGWMACAGQVAVEFDPTENFSGYRTWDWLPRRSEPLDVEGIDAQGLHELILAEVERALELRGYPRSAPSEGEVPDFYVTYHVRIRRELVLVTETPATQFLPSFHASPSYVVSAVEQRIQAFEASTLAIDVADGHDKQLVWRGAYERRVRGSFRPHLKAAVDHILERFPPVAEQALARSD